MTIIKENIVDKIEVLEMGQVQVRTATVIKEDDAELSRSFHRHVLSNLELNQVILGVIPTYLVKMLEFKLLQMQLGLMKLSQLTKH